ncbi:MAG: methylornithine synthase PylB, partial [Planctomycetes bacterium]|nr:methylornithine synthase PylB [Planctomycetota bacterium]
MNQHAEARQESRRALETIVERSQQRVPLSRSDMTWVLGLTDPDGVQDLFKAARQLREQSFGNRVFLYGFIYFSTYCRNSCGFCLYRKGNANAIRYRKSHAEIMASCQRLSESGIHLMDLTMGEDPDIFQAGDQGFESLLETIRSVKQLTNLPIMVSAGVLPETVLDQLAEVGVTWYACYQETHNQALYETLRTTQDYDLRINSKQQAKAKGL